ncbi:MAG: hypothetical protein J4F41_06080 [Alphaproteobacteria bacterium]|nr:hypothetical protein [Alphaproteobacteria bacterium]
MTSTETTAAASSETSEQDASGGDFVAIEDDPLIVDASAIMDDDGMGEVSVQWQISKNASDWMNISGATQQSFTPRELHVGRQLRVVITYVDGQGNLETLVSPASTPVQNVNDKPTGSPILTGAAREEDALVVDTSTISDEDGIGSYEVIWQRSSTKTEWQAYPDAKTEVLRLGQEHVGFSYRAVITYVDSHNTREVLISNPSEVLTTVDHPVEGDVVLSGEPLEGNTMTVRTNSVSDEDGIASLSLSWEYSKDGRNWRAVDTTSTSAIKLDQSLVGMQVRAKASVVDTFGVETLIYSQPTNTVKNVNNTPVGKINVRRVGS